MSKHPDTTLMEHLPSLLADPLPPPPSQPQMPATMPATTLNRKILGLFCNLTAVHHQSTLPLDAQAKTLATLSSQKRVEYKKLAKGLTPANPTKASQKDPTMHSPGVGRVYSLLGDFVYFIVFAFFSFTSVHLP
ncbi:hypothetical protein BKA83DRAFT_4496049 [Pisolithus microcarpus]|nr:hypothetical protein BKA83DRAFT_4496049 [Pisolithus microcarpus]